MVGSGASTTIIVGGGVGRVVYISTHVILSKFTIQNGAASNGAGIYNKGRLTIERTSISGNSASSVRDGNVNDSGNPDVSTLTINNSTISGNGAGEGDGGGIDNCRVPPRPSRTALSQIIQVETAPAL